MPDDQVALTPSLTVVQTRGQAIARGRLDRSALPALRTSFIGRDREVQRVKRLLADSRLVTLTGPGGIGKTRLAIEAARASSNRFIGGVFFVELAAVRDPELVLQTIGAALGVAVTDQSSAIDDLAERLGESETLLVLDNFEHILDAAPAVSSLLAASRTVRIAVTSRTRLRLAGEQEYPVAPLEVPERERVPLEQLEEIGSVALFAERARAVRPEFAVTDTNARAVAEVCRRLDGLPLALELAAARTKLLSPAALLARLERRLATLSHGPTDVPARQRTLRETMAWSYDLLRPSEQEAFRRLAVFVGGFTFEAAAEVVPDPGMDPRVDFLDIVGALVDHSLVMVTEDGDGDSRFLMLETIREFAMDQVAEAEGELLRDRHLAYFVRFAEEQQAHERGRNQTAWLRRMAAERDNVRAALAHALARRDGQRLLRLAAALDRRFWLASGDLDLAESRRWLDAGLAMTARVSPAVRAKALHRLALTHAVSSARLVSLLEESLSGYRRAADDVAMIGVLAELGHLSIYLDDLAAADQRLHEGLALARRVDAPPQQIVELLVPLSLLAHRRRDHPLARARVEEALRLARDAEDASGAAHALGQSGRLALAEHDFEQAAAAFSEGVDLARSLGDTEQLVIAQSELASARIASGELDAARTILFDAARSTRELNWWYLVMVLDAIADWLCGAGAYADAVPCLAAAEGTRPATEMDWDPDRVAARSRLVERSRKALRRTDFEAAWAAGEAASLAAILERALRAVEAVDVAVQPATVPQVRGRNDLSPRELEVLALIAEGLSDAEIAGELFISKKTASVHVAHIKDKLGATSRVEIALTGLRLGLTESARPQRT